IRGERIEESRGLRGGRERQPAVEGRLAPVDDEVVTSRRVAAPDVLQSGIRHRLARDAEAHQQRLRVVALKHAAARLERRKRRAQLLASGLERAEAGDVPGKAADE